MISERVRPAITGPDLVFNNVAPGGSIKQSVKMPGGIGETFVLSNIVATGVITAGLLGAVIEGRIRIDFPDQKKTLTPEPVHWMTFFQRFNPFMAEVVMNSGTIVDVTVYNDGAVIGNFTVQFLGHVETGR